MTCLVLACLVALAEPRASGAWQAQEQFERHYLQDIALAGPAGGETGPPADRPEAGRLLPVSERRP